MEEKLEKISFLSLQGSDSGLTLVNTDALVRKTELQLRQLAQKDKEIEELKSKLEHHEDMVAKYASQLESTKKQKEQAHTNWTKALIEENGEMKERIDLLFDEKQQFEKECFILQGGLEEKEQEIEVLKESINQLRFRQKEISLIELQEMYPLVKGLHGEYMKLKEEAKLLSVENEELGNECLILAEGMEVKAKEVMVLEERIKCLESKSEACNEREIEEKDQEERAFGVQEKAVHTHQEEGDSDGELIIAEGEMEDDLSDGELSVTEQEGVKVQQKSIDILPIGKILPGEMTNAQEYLDHVKELQLMKSLVSKIATYLKIDHGNFLPDVLGDIERQTLNLVDGNKDLQDKTKELHSLVEFLELEHKFSKEEFEEAKARNAELSIKLQEATEKAMKAQDQSENNERTKDSEGKQGKAKRRRQRGGVAATVYAKRKKLCKENSSIKVHLKSYEAKVAGLRKCMNALAGKNLELQMEVGLLKETNADARRERDEFELALKKEMQANMHLHQKLEDHEVQESQLSSCKSKLEEDNNEIDAMRFERCIILEEVEMGRQLYDDLRRGLQLAMVGKEVVEVALQKETGKFEDSERKLVLVEAEKTRLQEQYNVEMKRIIEEVKVLKEKNDESAKDLEGEMKIRFVYERKLNEYFSEKKILEERLEDEAKKNLEVGNVVSALQEIIERMKKPKRSRLSRFFRRGSD